MITQAQLKELLFYDPETGEFHWLRNGKVAGGKDHGYLRICISGKLLKAHRLAWLYVHGYFPEHDIDHINRVRDDNRISNLREVSRTCNARNASGKAGSSSGVKGVHKVRDRWTATITVNGYTISLGTFLTKLGAAKARADAEKEHGFITCDQLSEAQIFVNSQPPEEDSRVEQSSSSGVSGVYWNKRAKKWQANTYSRGVKKYLGLYNTLQEATEARNKVL